MKPRRSGPSPLLSRSSTSRPARITTLPTTVYTSTAIKRGAADFLNERVNDQDLLAAVRRAVAHDHRSRQAWAELKNIQGRLATLTPREREVLEHVVAGQLNKRIAGDLGTVEKTIKVHRVRVMRKILALNPERCWPKVQYTRRIDRIRVRSVSNSAQPIAIVDDDEAVRKGIARLLRSAGLSARAFASATEFLASLGEFLPSCVVLDLHMPGLSGFSLMETLQGRFPIVIITGHDSPEAHTRAMTGGAAAYLTKPVGDNDLLEAISSAVTRGTDQGQ
jgi:FixJ family two-component response regulator